MITFLIGIIAFQVMTIKATLNSKLIGVARWLISPDYREF